MKLGDIPHFVALHDYLIRQRIVTFNLSQTVDKVHDPIRYRYYKDIIDKIPILRKKIYNIDTFLCWSYAEEGYSYWSSLHLFLREKYKNNPYNYLLDILKEYKFYKMISLLVEEKE